MKILVINAGSSSLKFQLIDMDDESVKAKGLVERIGIEGTHFKQTVLGTDKVIEFTRNMKDHTEAISAVLSALTDKDNGAITSLDEIGACGHRVLHGGETFKNSVLVTEETMKGIEELVPLGPLHQPANIAGIKDSSGNWDNLKGYIEATKGMDFSVLSGNDSLILPALKEGGAGGITAVANIYPETMVSIYRRFLAGDIAGAEEAQNSIANIRACFKFGNPNTVTKKATNLNDNPVGPCRAPFCYLSDEAVAEIARTLEADRAKGMR